MTEPHDDGELERLRLDLANARAELDSFAYSVSHDLRAPLRAVNGFGDLLAGRIGGDLDADARELLDAVLRNAKRMEAMLEGLSSLVRVQRHHLERREVDMDELVRATLEALQTETGSARIDLSPMPRAFGDARLLAQAWQALLSNALKFRSDVNPAVISVGGREEPDACVYHVTDDGVGFDMKYVGRLFNAFQRLHSQKEFEGLGIGLALADRIVRRHGGRMWAEAEPGKGATFSFALPRPATP
jgi:light-regulated signal transduction histidine kinase (bacteriophytochrome)